MKVDAGGVATGISNGKADITATLEEISRTRTMIVDGKPPKITNFSGGQSPSGKMVAAGRAVASPEIGTVWQTTDVTASTRTGCH